VADTSDDSDQAAGLKQLQAASIVYRIAFGPRAGQKVLTLPGAVPTPTVNQRAYRPQCANLNGFSLHAGVYCESHERAKLERLCRYITRPALANDRIKVNATGQVELKLKTPWSDGTTHQVMSPLEFMQRLAALVPRPRLHLIRYHGVLAPNAKWRQQVIPASKQEQPGPTAVAFSESEGIGEQVCQGRPLRLGWAKLLKRVFNLDMEHCPHCGGKVRVIAAILERAQVQKILNHLGLDPQPPPRGAAQGQFEDQMSFGDI
jgi:hypothetical protein